MEDLKCFRPVPVDCGAVQKIRPHAAKKKVKFHHARIRYFKPKYTLTKKICMALLMGGFCHAERSEKGTKWGEGLYCIEI